jgi:hypothetical protein
MKADMTLIAKSVESLFSSPLGVFPRGGLASSLRLTVNKSPSKITLTTSRGLSVSLSALSDVYVVWDGEVERVFESLQEAVLELLIPVLEEEIKHCLSQ